MPSRTETNTESHSAAHKAGATDIRLESALIRILPTGWKPYGLLLRLDRPAGSWLLLLPCWWSVALASPGWPDWKLVGLFFMGAFIMRGAGCTFNDIIDRNFDAQVARTALRPIPSGQVSVKSAFVFFNLVCLLGLIVLLQFNSFSIWLGVLALVPLAVYPFMKRFVYFPQLFMGFAFNWGSLLGWAAVNGSLSLAPGLLYLAGIAWTLGYDTIYAHQDKEDDIAAGVKSLALKLGDNTRPWLAVFYGISISLTAAAGWAAGLSWLFYVVLAAPALHLFWQVTTVDLDDPKDCLAKFRASRDYGLLVFAAIAIGQVVR